MVSILLRVRMGDDLIRVAVRIRPLVPSEIEKGCQECLSVVPGEHQIQIRPTDKAFSFNYVFDSNIGQAEFYETAIKKMIIHIFQGYNVTILAYGQTGSGKTHSMGTNYSETSENIGVIPRAVEDIFEIIKSQEKEWDYKVTVAFMELYQEQLYDLLAQKQRSQCIVEIREDAKNIKIVGITERNVSNAKETLQCLADGSLCRATGATAMNSHSIRSHAIFTISVHQQEKNDPTNARTAKFQLVDLAGSERSKKTQATGERFKESVNINKGLIALGNVISQLGECGTASYVGYRDSKLTRLLQDSLGGNSMTLMIACVSPADYNLDESLSTLRYADRARKIKNKPVINQDPQVAEINRLKKVIQDLKMSRLSQEIQNLASCPPEHQELDEKNQLMQKKLRALTEKLSVQLIELVYMHERAELAEQLIEKFKSAMVSVSEECKELMNQFETSPKETEGHRRKLESIGLKILNLQKEQKKTAEELVNHDLSSGSLSSVSLKMEDEEGGGDANETYDLDEMHEEHTLRQVQTIEQVQTITRELAIKELVSKLLQSFTEEAEQSQVRDMETEINKLQAEKEELQQQLNSVQNSKAASKLAETLRKKVQELEKKISDLSRKCMEQNRENEKQKEKSDQQIKNLANEIQSLKQTNVKLIRRMRTEAERFRKWKLTRERELSKLKDQDRKRVNQTEELSWQVRTPPDDRNGEQEPLFEQTPPVSQQHPPVEQPPPVAQQHPPLEQPPSVAQQPPAVVPPPLVLHQGPVVEHPLVDLLPLLFGRSNLPLEAVRYPRNPPFGIRILVSKVEGEYMFFTPHTIFLRRGGLLLGWFYSTPYGQHIIAPFYTMFANEVVYFAPAGAPVPLDDQLRGLLGVGCEVPDNTPLVEVPDSFWVPCE